MCSINNIACVDERCGRTGSVPACYHGNLIESHIIVLKCMQGRGAEHAPTSLQCAPELLCGPPPHHERSRCRDHVLHRPEGQRRRQTDLNRQARRQQLRRVQRSNGFAMAKTWRKDASAPPLPIVGLPLWRSPT